MEKEKSQKVLLEKVKSVIYIKAKVAEKTILSCGPLDYICDTFGVAHPLIPKNLTTFIRQRLKADSVKRLTKKQWLEEKSKIADSGGNVIFL